MKKIILHLTAAVVTSGCFALTVLLSPSLNLITYLVMSMLLPILLNIVLILISFRRFQLKSPIIHSVALCLIYVCSLQALWYLLDITNGFSYIYQNSANLVTEGFSIGNDIGSTNISDLIMPGGVSFLLFYIFTAIAHHKSQKTSIG